MTLIFKNSFSINGSEEEGGGGGGSQLNPPYSYNISPALRSHPSYSYTGVNIIGSFTDVQQPPYWATNMGYNHDITPSNFDDISTIEVQCKFRMYSNPSYMQELFNLCGIFTPDIETSGKLGFWDETNSQYWLEYSFNINTWYWLKLYYDVATYTQTWYISTDGTNFTTIGTHTEDRTIDLRTAWNNTDTSTGNASSGWLLFGAITKGLGLSSDRTMQNGVIDMSETYIKTNGEIRCYGYIQGS